MYFEGAVTLNVHTFKNRVLLGPYSEFNKWTIHSKTQETVFLFEETGHIIRHSIQKYNLTIQNSYVSVQSDYLW